MSTDTHATPGATDAEADATEGRVYNVSGGDWDEIVTEDSERGFNEQIVVNMGPQHPSTHGVLRLILTLEGETVTDARASIGYLHTGIEKSMEYRTWTQGTTFITRADYLTPLFNEATYCLGIERLLGVEDRMPGAGPDHPRADARAEPDRVAPGRDRPVRPRARGDDDLPAGRPHAGERPRPVRADHRPADEPRVHPSRRRRAGPAGRRARGDPRLPAQGARVDHRPAQADRRERGVHRQDQGHRLPRPRGVHGPRRDRADPARHRAALGPAQVAAGDGLRDLRVRRPDGRHLRHLRPLPDPDGRDRAVAADRPSSAWTGSPTGPASPTTRG